MRSTTSSAYPATRFCSGSSTRAPTTSAPPRARAQACAARLLVDAHPASRRCPRPIICATPSSLRCGSGCSSSAPALSKPSRASAWPSPPPVPRQVCSGRSPAICYAQDRDRRGSRPRRTTQLPPSSTFTSPDTSAVKKTRAATCPTLSGKDPGAS